MKTVHVYVKTNMQGSTACAGDTGFSEGEWAAMSVEERIAIEDEMIWDAIQIMTKLE